jgi:adenine-specific DNA methylase
MSENIVLTIIEFGASLIVEGIILSMVFNWISNKETEKQQKILQQEMNNIETQNKFIYEQLKDEMKEMKREIISQIKESAAASKKGGN